MTQQVETGRYSRQEEHYVVFHRFEDGLDTLMAGFGFVCNMKLWSLSPQIVQECLHVHVANAEPDGLFHYHALEGSSDPQRCNVRGKPAESDNSEGRRHEQPWIGYG